MSSSSRSGTRGAGGGAGGARGTKARAARLGQSDPPSAGSKADPKADSSSGTAEGRPKAGTSRASGAKASGSSQASGSSKAGRASTGATGQRAPTRAQKQAADRVDQAGPDPERQAALVEERDFLLGSLRDLEAEHDAGDVDDRDYDALRDDYTARAAAVLRALDGETPARRRRREAPRSRSRLVAGALVAVLAVATGVAVAQWSGSRSSNDSITGGIRTDSRDELVQARQDSANGQYLQAIKDYDQVLQDDPANTEALAYKGWMLRIVALSASGSQQTELRAEALASLQQALRTSPTDGTSLVFLAVLEGDLGHAQDALDTLAKVPAGGVPAGMASTIDQFKAQMQAKLASG